MVDTNTQIRISAYSALLFFLVSNPETYKIVRSIAGNWVSSASGCPSRSGLVLHSLVFLAIVFLSMRAGGKEGMHCMGKRESMKTDCGCA